MTGGHARPATGIHEVLVEGRGHEGDLTTFDPALRTLVLQGYRDRLQAMEAMDGIRHVSVFRNRGRRGRFGSGEEEESTPLRDLTRGS